jgi:hypothetical protein
MPDATDRETTPRIAAALIATALGTTLLWSFLGSEATLPELAPGEHGWSGDFRSYYLPNAEYLGARLAAGELPLWNPHHGAGAPFLAALQAGVLYPPNWIHAALPAQTAFFVLALLHIALAVGFAGSLAAALGAGAAGAALAGLLYGSSMQVVVGIWSPPVLYTAAWAPGLVLAIDRVLARPSGRAAATLAAALALPLLAGWPYAVAITALAGAVYGSLWLIAELIRSRRFPWRALAALGFGVTAGVMLAAPQLLPANELVARSCRALGTLVEGQALGGGVTRPYDPAQTFGALLRNGYSDGIPGLIALTLALLSVALPGAGRARSAALLAAGALGLLASFPNHAPVYSWLRELPLFSDFRFPFRYRLLPTIALAVTAGVGLAHLQALVRRWSWAPSALAVAALMGALFTASIPVFRSVLPFARSWEAEPGLVEEIRARGDRTFAAAPGDRIYWAGRSDRQRPPASVDAVHDMEPLTLARTAQLLTFFETGRGLTLLTLPRPAAPQAGPSGDFLAPPFFGYLVLPDRPARAAILDLFAITSVVAETPPVWLDERFVRRSSPDASLSVFDNPHALPRAYRVSGALPEPADPKAGLAALTAPRFDPRRRVWLDSPPPSLLPRPGAAAPAPLREVEIVDYAPERVVLRSAGDSAGVVVVADAHYPGWHAQVNGVDTPVLRANFGFRGVVVPAGPSEVVMRYRPSLLQHAIAMAGIAAIACVVAWRHPRLRAAPRDPGRWRRKVP